MKKLSLFLFLLCFINFSSATPVNSVSSLTVVINPPAGTPPFCTNIAYQFSGSASPGPIILWQWSCNPSAGVNIQNSNQNSTNITFTNSGSYTLTLLCANTNGITDSAKYALTVNATPSIITAPQNTTMCLGGSGATFYAAGATSYTWAPIANIITVYPNGDSAKINPPGLGVYTYSVTGSNVSGCTSNTSVISVTVNPQPQPTFIAFPSDTICEQSTSSLSANGMPSATTFTWSASSSAGLSANSGYMVFATPVYSGSVDTTFSYLVNMSVNGCPSYPTYTINLVVSPCSNNIPYLTEESIKIYPNPASTILHFTDLPGGASSFKIINNLGEVCSEGKSGKEIAVSSLSDGIYFLILDKEQYKIIIQH